MAGVDDAVYTRKAAETPFWNVDTIAAVSTLPTGAGVPEGARAYCQENNLTYTYSGSSWSSDITFGEQVTFSQTQTGTTPLVTIANNENPGAGTQNLLRFTWFDSGGVARTVNLHTNSSAATLLRVDAGMVITGALSVTAGIDSAGTTNALITYGKSILGGALLSSGAQFPLIVRGATSQSADLQQWQDINSVILTAIASDGKLLFGASGAQDTNLYRAAADFLKTDDGFSALTHQTHNAYVYMAEENTGGMLWLSEQTTDAAAPGANYVKIYAKDTGGGKTQLVARFNTGAVQVIATEP